MALLARQPTPSPHRALVAAATRINFNDRRDAARVAAARQDWQREAWDYFDAIGEIKQAFWLTGNQLSKLRLYAAVRPDPSEPPIPITDSGSGIDEATAALAERLLDELRGPFGGQAEIIREANINFDVAGECFLVGRAERPPVPPEPGRPDGGKPGRPAEWDIKSIDEVDVDSDGKVKVQFDDTGEKEPLDEAAGDVIIRMWLRHPRNSWKADSPLHGVLGECEAVLIFSAAIRAEGRSRLSSGKILKVPDDLSFGAPDPTHDEGDGEAEADPFMRDLMDAMLEPIGEEGAASAVVPIVIRGKAESLAQLDTVDLSHDLSNVLEERIEKRIIRIARGVNLPLEKMMGHQATTFANAAQVDQDDFDDHLQPRATLICEALTHGYHRPRMLDAGVAEDVTDRIVVWFDASDLVSDPQLVDNVKLVQDYLSIEAQLRHLGFDPADAASEEELLQRMGLFRGVTGETLTLMLLRLLQDSLRPPTDLPSDNGNGDGQGQGARAITAASRPVPREPGRRLMEIDRQLRARLEVAADAAVQRALERAGARLRSRVGSARAGAVRNAAAEAVANVDNLHAVARLGPSLVAQAGLSDDDLLAGSFDLLEAQWDTWVTQAQAQALAEVAAVVPLSDGERADIEATQAEDRADGWVWLAAALAALARARLFDPDPAAPMVGEHDTSLTVPPGVIRGAVARAGGGEGIEPGPAATPMIQGGTRPAGGVATGQRLASVLAGHGAAMTGWEWDYGPAARSRVFEPHLRLDGVRFTDWADSSLSNTSGFPAVSHFAPGDHPGCRCDAIPIIVAPAERAA